MMGRALAAALRWAGILLYHLGFAPLVIRRARRRPKVLLYHACEPAESDFTRGLRSNTTPADFDRHLAFLRRYYRVVPLASLEGGNPPERAVVITFDDGYASVRDHALPSLRRHGLPATVYLITGVVGNDALVWVNELNWFLNARAREALPRARARLGAADAASASELVERARATYDPAAVGSLLTELRRALGTDGRRLAQSARIYLDWADVRGMIADGITFGSHTVSHPNLERLDAETRECEMRSARTSVINHLGACTSLAYPFGDHDDASRQAALRLGHRSIMHVGGVNAPLDLTRVARVPVYAKTEAELFAEMEIIMPAKTLLRRLVPG